MILIDKYGFLHASDAQTGERYTIEDKEVLSFLRQCIQGIYHKFTVRDFIKMFERYPSLQAIIPEFDEVGLCARQYDSYQKVDIESLCMQIGASIVAVEAKENSAMFFNLFGLTKLQENVSINISPQVLAIRNVINSNIVILTDMDVEFEVNDDKTFKGHLPFDIQNFTLFDFISVVGTNLVRMVDNDNSGDDAFEELKHKIFKMKDSIVKNLGLDLDESQIDPEEVKDNTDDIFKQIGNIVNPPNSDGKKH